ncbi:MAG: hypothetical protein MK171_03020 [Pirellulales bacterium]|nr:hypothetical protein [Pirellulales bacterium]
MARLQLGRQFEAENDMRVGANLEAQQLGDRPSISKALQRVQGHGRRTLEKFRRQARLERAQLIRSQTKNRYEQLQRRGDIVLYQDNPVRLELLLDPSSGATAPAGTRSPQPSLSEPREKAPKTGGLGVGDQGIGKSAFGDTVTEDAVAAENDQNDPFGFEAAPSEATSDEDDRGSGAPDEGETADEAVDEDPFSEFEAPITEPGDLFSEESASVAGGPPTSDTLLVADPGGTSASERFFFELGRWISQPAAPLPGWVPQR